MALDQPMTNVITLLLWQ